MEAMLVMFALFCLMNANEVLGDIGTATSYAPPYLPTKCPGYNQDELPPNGFFVAAGTDIWDNGAACGRRYQVRCLSGLRRPCKNGFVVVQVVDLCRMSPCPTMAFSSMAFDAISRIPNTKINIEYQQV
ncbi:hypothetical protein LUZ60_009690 [Juncus effusus]|nr:hypothetical protein LUZ60_009690 [Juncus effusus]